MNAGGVDKACKSNESVRGTDARKHAEAPLGAVTRKGAEFFCVVLRKFLRSSACQCSALASGERVSNTLVRTVEFGIAHRKVG